ncbi:hypothetical protein PAMC26577_29785 [Caballeronia sordidicola]|uniref:Uncharacterized protein n=1 Tax=Caballeronia sordidicola TaxID=196367 RepID=A0A242MFC1_CABSO|nr:hypothetical protein PAMC26577_29785 [Caballeronia sordidicola]
MFSSKYMARLVHLKRIALTSAGLNENAQTIKANGLNQTGHH